eukprot:TRINITY_DN1650_c0_g1_i2.p1 TRINITY_DN1650_c0_g1~~TRINITY_DN1650_c0_g1_i2.p1  ORF type:complete len:173 (-),score=33.67 TRINITY_DN1650_c0_g1_i2:178-696(-)
MGTQKRLQKEFTDLVKDPPSWLKATLFNDNIFKWKVLLLGPDKSPFEKGVFELQIDVPTEYPFKPPKFTFLTKVYHPNVKSDGQLCAEMLTPDWSPQLRIQEGKEIFFEWGNCIFKVNFLVLLTVRQMLAEPNPENPLEQEIANVYKTNKAKFEKTAKEWTKNYALAPEKLK